MIISQGKKEDFLAFEEVGKSVWNLKWGKQDVVEKVGQINEETGEWELTGEVKETSLCTYELHRFFQRPTLYTLSKLLDTATRVPNAAELLDIARGFNFGEDQILKWLKERMVKAVERFDSSNEVNEFTINGIPVWLDKNTRTGLQLRFASELALGKTQTTLWYGKLNFTLELSQAQTMLHLIEEYASRCYDHTQSILVNLDSLNTIDEVVLFDYKTGYPEKLSF